MKKTKEDATSAGTPKKKKPENKGRLSSMLESMQKRSSPVNAHKVATKYFDDFKKERSIPEPQERSNQTTAVNTDVDTAKTTSVNTAVSSTIDTAKTTAVDKKQHKTPSSKSPIKASGYKILDDSHTQSEAKVYFSMRDECASKKKQQLRFGLKELKDKTGLSDKTIRNAIHSLEKKLSIEIVEPSLGVYGRKIRVFNPDEIEQNRKKANLVIDSTTKKIEDSSTAGSAVTTAVVDYKKEVAALYKKYTGNSWDNNAEKFYKTIKEVKPEVVESAFILGSLKEKGKNNQLSDFKNLFKELSDKLPEGYINHLRDIWKTRG
ncbi:MAG: hypothetical protein GWM89_09795 [Candidatus Dadabacteria bacterium]|nr:hypothetical protein [Candidatus Dadabacteria bacterium]NIY22693.1 hypothetical protein [Candidatus Dadabacteria bacterium]